MKRLVVTVMLVVMLFSGGTSAFAAQLVWDARTSDHSFAPKFTFQRTVSITYQNDGVIADDLRGKSVEIHILAMGSPEIVEMMNARLQEDGSFVRVSDVQLDYSARLVGRDTDASIDYMLVMTPTITPFLIREYSEQGTALLDASWRGIKLDGPVYLSDSSREIEINLPISFLQKEFPDTYNAISGTEAEKILKESLIDASGIGQTPLTKWHALFDPTSIMVDATKFGFEGEIVTTYSMGESRIGAPTKEKIVETSFVADRQYGIRTLEAADNANIFVPGYASPDILSGSEVIGTSPEPLDGIQTNDQGRFPILIIYGMAGMAAAGAVGFFMWSSKKAKHESSGQTGIDPSHLRSVQTSASSGGYQTNRGEAHLIGKVDHEQTRDIYKKGDSRTMPKDWK